MNDSINKQLLKHTCYHIHAQEIPGCAIALNFRPTLEKRRASIAKINCPLGYWFDLGTNYEKDPIWKVHGRQWMKSMGTFDPQEETLILIVRNPKEAIKRHMGKLNLEILNDQLVLNYFDNLALYDVWNPGKRLLIYYEDLIRHPELVYRKLLNFLDASDAYLSEFMDKYTWHKKQALAIYAEQEGRPITQGNTALHHSLSLPLEERKAIDAYIARQYPTLWQRYLKDRYQE